MKRIVLCCDGTWNSPDRESVSNIEKIARSVRTGVVSDGVAQSVFTIGGVGAGGYLVDKVLGGAFGYGLTRHVLDGYRVLALNYDPGDEVYVFGFSRGAYTARSVVGMVASVGLLRPQAVLDNRLRQAGRLYRSRGRAEDDAERTAFRANHCYTEVPITMLGVFDTVGALGVPGLTRRRSRFHDVRLSPSVACARQALAIDDRRRTYEPCLWTAPDGSPDLTSDRVKQVWFPGAHSDVGGGAPHQGLSDITLRWMLDEAEGAASSSTPTGSGHSSAPSPCSRCAARQARSSPRSTSCAGSDRTAVSVATPASSNPSRAAERSTRACGSLPPRSGARPRTTTATGATPATSAGGAVAPATTSEGPSRRSPGRRRTSGASSSSEPAGERSRAEATVVACDAGPMTDTTAQSGPPVPPETLVPPDAHVLGDPGAPVTLVEFGDLECPYCRDAAPVLREVVETSGGQVRLVFRHFPLFEVHPHALTAALAVEAAGAVGAFWPVQEALFAAQPDLGDEVLRRVAVEHGVDGTTAVGSGAQGFGDTVERDYADGLAAGVLGTPTLFVDGVRFRGPITTAAVRAAVDAAAAGTGQS
ncbi:hypothetical protein GCM10025865_02950 [Paraoerskovia sediminicola]|uniref:Thioredoxin domain-containing protein n=1 Tax=Paraoerskovia sediminicola TaxID=1138587 RepID=A0ABM8FZ09_9CELL|nr:DUF2235 domain-containing protein [Paraoerskovia sediminicola]BDZ40996.1 hypothetical protein GCM10025865_02950 [Paraoerskovia sediminicola]